MAWPLNLLGTFDHYPRPEDLAQPAESGPARVVQPGDCFYYSGDLCDESLGAIYKRDWLGKRLPLMIFTPSGWWSPDQRAHNVDGWHGDGWTVTGEAPNITVTPSIHFIGAYHGWVTAGVLTDPI